MLLFAYFLVSSISGLKAFRLHYLCGRSKVFTFLCFSKSLWISCNFERNFQSKFLDVLVNYNKCEKFLAYKSIIFLEFPCVLWDVYGYPSVLSNCNFTRNTGDLRTTLYCSWNGWDHFPRNNVVIHFLVILSYPSNYNTHNRNNNWNTRRTWCRCTWFNRAFRSCNVGNHRSVHCSCSYCCCHPHCMLLC